MQMNTILTTEATQKSETFHHKHHHLQPPH
jgi:hypothetical protein